MANVLLCLVNVKPNRPSPDVVEKRDERTSWGDFEGRALSSPLGATGSKP